MFTEKSTRKDLSFETRMSSQSLKLTMANIAQKNFVFVSSRTISGPCYTVPLINKEEKNILTHVFLHALSDGSFVFQLCLLVTMRLTKSNGFYDKSGLKRFFFHN